MRPFLRFLDKVIDPLLAVVVFILLVMVVIENKDDEWGFIVISLFILIFHMTVPLWVAFRVLPRASRLALDRAWREELAVTPLAASEVLSRRILRPMARAALPIAGIFAASAILTIEKAPSLAAFLADLGLYILLVAMSLIGIVAICLWAFALSFRVGETAGSVLRHRLLAGFLSVVWVIAAFYIPITIGSLTHGESLGLVIILIFGAVVLITGSYMIRRLWRTACVRFYQFE